MSALSSSVPSVPLFAFQLQSLLSHKTLVIVVRFVPVIFTLGFVFTVWSGMALIVGTAGGGFAGDKATRLGNWPSRIRRALSAWSKSLRQTLARSTWSVRCIP